MKLKVIPNIFYEPINEITFNLEYFTYKNNFSSCDIFLCGFMRLPAQTRGVWRKADAEGMGIFTSLSSSLNIDIFDIPPHPAYELKEEKIAKEGICPRCGNEGTWVNLALVCPEHGVLI